MDFNEAQEAIKKGDVIGIRHFLDSGGDANLCNQKNGLTLLMLASHNGNTAIGRELIQKGARLDSRDFFGWTALATAAHNGHPGFVKLLIESGASLEGHPFGSSFEDFLDWASQYGTGSPEAMIKTRKIVREKRETV